MKDPQEIKTVVEKSTYIVPTFCITDSGIEDGPEQTILFCKGNKNDANALRQTGFFTETLLEVCAQYLRENNVGDLSNRDTALAITYIENALLRIQKRANDRKRRGVQTTYNK